VLSDLYDAHRRGRGTPLVLLHGLGMSWRAWTPLLPALEARHDVLALTLPGHRGGPPAPDVVSVERLADAVEAALDEAGLSTAHLVGNSLGGWLSLELARRGRARSVTAVSPAGAWRNPLDLLRLQVNLAVSGHLAALPFSGAVFGPMLHTRSGRRAVFRRLMERGDRMTPAQAMSVLEDAHGCTVLDALLRAGRRDGQIEALTDVDCPIRVVWGRRDRVIPYARHGRPLLRRLPGVEQVSLPGAGHVPMYDAPVLLRGLVLELAGGVDASTRIGAAG